MVGRTSSLVVKKRTLNAGIYIARLVVSIDGVGLESSDEVFISVIEDALHVNIQGKLLITYFWFIIQEKFAVLEETAQTIS